MKCKSLVLLLISILLMTSCNSATDKNLQLTYENILSSYELIKAENENLKKILADNGISDYMERHPIDIDFQNFTLNPEVSGSSSQMRDAFLTYADKWKVEMEKYFDLLTSKLDDDKVRRLAESQSKWEECKKANDELDVQSYIQAFGGLSHIRTYGSERLP